jgi:diadenosine tetraphosphatase ApaH/serine/threonine PP2A family protein phosphatase
VNRSFLLELPRETRAHDHFLFHGSIHNTNRYILSRDDIEDNFQSLAALPGVLKLGFFGHTHIRTALCDYQGSISMRKSPELALLPDNRYLINPGSVGQPRDGDPRAAFLVYEATDHVIIFHRVEYDIRKCQDKIIREGLPPQLAERLGNGW